MTETTEAGRQIAYDTFYIGGEWRPPSTAATITLISPSTEEVVGTVPDGAQADLDAAVAAARRAFDDPTGWSTWDPGRRGELLERFAVAVEKRAEETARRVVAQNGMPWRMASQVEAVFPARAVRYYLQMAKERLREETRPRMGDGVTVIQRRPIGVAAAIVPWNVPQAMTFVKIAPALATGCTVVVKPSPETVLDQYMVAEAAEEAGLPPGVLNIVQGGRELGAYLVSHPGIDKVAFTGSTAAGRSIAEACGRLLRPVSLELGGKSAAIVLDDADLQGNVESLFGATLHNNGQTCWLCSRILAPRRQYDDVLDLLRGLLDGVTVGDPMDPETRVGPLTSARQRDRVESYVEKGRTEGGRVVVGGGRPDELPRGYYFEPTVFADVEPNHTIAQEEIFGPVLAVMPYDDIDDAVRLANDSDFGLGGSVWTRDRERGLAIARRVETGTIGINGYRTDLTAPFGGVKASGLGREFGPEGMDAYLTTKSIYVKEPAPVNGAG